MSTTNAMPMVLRPLTSDGWLLFVTRFARLFAYGSLSVILVFYLVGLGLTEPQTGLVLTLTLVGDVVVSLYLTTRADRIGRRRMLIVGSLLMAGAGLAFACTSNLFFLILAGTIGVKLATGGIKLCCNACVTKPPNSAPVAVATEPTSVYQAKTSVREAAGTR